MIHPNWKKLHKAFSVQACVILALIAGADAFWPALQDYLPPGWYGYGFILIAVARYINQNLEQKSPEHGNDTESGK